MLMVALDFLNWQQTKKITLIVTEKVDFIDLRFVEYCFMSTTAKVVVKFVAIVVVLAQVF